MTPDERVDRVCKTVLDGDAVDLDDRVWLVALVRTVQVAVRQAPGRDGGVTEEQAWHAVGGLIAVAETYHRDAS